MEAPQAMEASVQAPRQIIAAAVLATIPTILPGFLVGALSVQISGEFDVAEATYGWGIGGFFLAATVGSVALGRLAQHIGPRRQVTYALALSGLVAAVHRTLRRFVWSAGICAGSVRALQFRQPDSDQPAPEPGEAASTGPGNRLEAVGNADCVPLGRGCRAGHRMTVGWRWAYVIGAVGTVVAIINVRRVIAPLGRMERVVTKTGTPRRSLVIASVGFGFMAFSAGALNAWIVSSGVESGI
jgi:MFS family permease